MMRAFTDNATKNYIVSLSVARLGARVDKVYARTRAFSATLPTPPIEHAHLHKGQSSMAVSRRLYVPW